MLRHILILAICVSSGAITGCVESSFTLANESRLPSCIALPPGLTRKDVSVTLNLYAPLRGPDAKLILKDKRGKKLAEVRGNNATLLRGIELVPYREHANMEQNGRAVALFYVY